MRIAGSGDPKFIRLTVDVFAKGATATTAADAIAGADLVILAIPLHRVDSLDSAALAGHIVVDAMNHWTAVDGPLPAWPGLTLPELAHRIVAEANAGYASLIAALRADR